MEDHHKHYTCPMHPEIVKNAPGKCPKCGMDLVPLEKTHEHQHVHHQASLPSNVNAHHGNHSVHEEHGGFDKHAGHHTHDFLKRFWICLVVTIPVLLLSHMIQIWLGFEFKFLSDQYLLLLLSTFIYLYGGMPFLKGMIGEIKGNAIGMMIPRAIIFCTSCDPWVSVPVSEDELLKYVASVQQNSEHHIAHGLLKKAREKNLSLWPVENFTYMQGMGVKGMVNGKEVISAGPNYFRQNIQSLPAMPETIDQRTETVSYLLIDGKLAGIFTLADSIRASSEQAIDDLKKMNIKTYLLTGDNETIAKSVAEKLKMDGYFANVLPHEKQEKLKSFQSKGELVAMTVMK
jgi:cation transport ATPase